MAADLAMRGRLAFDAGRELEALADLERAFDLSGDVALLGMYGLSLRAAGRLPEAWLALNRFRIEAAANVRASLDARVQAALGELQGQLGALRIDGDIGARGQVIFNGEVVAALPLRGAIYLSPGDVRLEIRGEGRWAQEISARIRVGDEQRIEVDLPRADVGAQIAAVGAASADVPDLDVPAPSGGASFDPWPFVVTGGGLVVALGAVAGIASWMNDSIEVDLGNAELDCAATPELCSRTDADIAAAFEWVGYVGAGVGLAFAVTVGIVGAVVGSAASDVDADLDVDADVDAGIDCEDAERMRRQVRARQAQQARGICAPMLGETLGAGCAIQF